MGTLYEKINLVETIINEKNLSDEEKKILMLKVRELQLHILKKITEAVEKIINTELQDYLPVIESENIINFIDDGKEWLNTNHKINSVWDASILIQTLIDAEENPNSSIIRDSREYIMDENNRTSSGLWHSAWDKKENIFDTSFAVIALIESGVESKSETIQRAINFIEGSFHPFGGWSAIPSDDENIEVGATSWAIIALLKSGVDPSSEIIIKGVEWLKKNQNKDGGWGRWWNEVPGNTSLITRTYDAISALLEAGEDPKSRLIQRSLIWITEMQQLINEGEKKNQIWGLGWEPLRFDEIIMSDIENTATAALTLLNAGVTPNHRAVEASINWLLKRKSTSGHWSSDTPRVIMCLNRYIRQKESSMKSK